MPQTSIPSSDPRQVFDAYREGRISEERARRYFGDEWEDVQQLDRVEDILESQPEPEIDNSELFR